MAKLSQTVLLWFANEAYEYTHAHIHTHTHTHAHTHTKTGDSNRRQFNTFSRIQVVEYNLHVFTYLFVPSHFWFAININWFFSNFQDIFVIGFCYHKTLSVRTETGLQYTTKWIHPGGWWSGRCDCWTCRPESDGVSRRRRNSRRSWTGNGNGSNASMM